MKNFLKSISSVALCFIIAICTFATFPVDSSAYSFGNYYNYLYNYDNLYNYYSGSSYSGSSYKTHGNFTYKVVSGEATITDYDASAGGAVKIPSTIDDYSVTGIYSQAFKNCTKITSITIPASVKDMGYGAFEGCTGLKKINIPNGIKTVENYMFSGCTSLTEIVIPDGVKSIGNCAFEGCTSLKSITIPNTVTEIGSQAFEGCTSYKEINIPDSVTNIKTDAFLNTAYYNDGSAWENNALYIGNFLIRANSKISGSYTIKEGTKILANSAFEGCTLLEEVVIPNSITKIRYCAFEGCTSLKSITIPESVTAIGYNTFYNCTSLIDVVIPDSVTSIVDDAFYGVPNVSYSDNMKAEGSPWGAKAANGYSDGYLIYENSSKKKIVACGSAATKITISGRTEEVASNAFSGCKSLTDIYYRGSNGRNIKFDNYTDIGIVENATWHYNIFHVMCAVMFVLFVLLIVFLKKNKNIDLKKCAGFIPIILSLLLLTVKNSGQYYKVKLLELFTLKYLPASVLLYLGIILSLLIIIYPITAKGKRVCWKHVFVLSTLFGYDRFIRGQYGRGIIKLLTCGGLLIWAQVDFIIAASKAYGAEYRGIDYFTFVDGKYCKESELPVVLEHENELDTTEVTTDENIEPEE